MKSLTANKNSVISVVENVFKNITLNFTAVLILVSFIGCSEDSFQKNGSALFPKGNLAPENNTGNVWVEFLLSPDSICTTAIGNESFAPGARTHWHVHPAGKILMVTEGTGYHKINGKPIEIIMKRDVVKCPPNIAHWHGAVKDESLAHIFIVPNTEEGIMEWKEPVTDEELTL